jgi:CheY-like chemotaxis protein
MNNRPPKILFIADDEYGSSTYVRLLEAAGFDVRYVHSARQGLRVASTRRQFDAVVVDIMMPADGIFDRFETAGGFKTGIALARELIECQPSAVFLALTNSQDEDVKAWFGMQERFGYCYKGDALPDEFPTILRNKISGVPDMPSIFIVHGHDRQAALDLKNYLQNVLGLPEPTILAEQPSRGMTLIEKFEHYASDTDLVFALFTPDDFQRPRRKSGRARQNVLFEYGYFLGVLGRRSGRVFLLYKDGVEIPSDLAGIVYVNITGGIEGAGEQLRRELRGLIPEPD